MTCGCRRCTLDDFNRLMAAGEHCFLPPIIYYCSLCKKPTCDKAMDHRHDCRREIDRKARWARYWNGKEMQR